VEIMKKKEKPLAIGVDLGGTKVLAAIVDEGGNILAEERYPTHPEKGAEWLALEIIKNLEKLRSQVREDVVAIGVGAAGQVDSSGKILSAPNLPFSNEPLQKRIEEELGIPATVTNDVRASTYGEWRYGSGKGVDDLVVLFVGTGIGGGVVIGGRLLGGCSNTFGELGHITLVSNGRKCRCPNLGCIEAYAGGWAIAERTKQAVSENPNKGKAIFSTAGNIEDITSNDLREAFEDGDPLAKMLVDETGDYLGAGLVGIVNAFNPCVLVLGGGVIEGIPYLIQRTEKIIRKHSLKPSQDKLMVARASLGGKAGVVGAASLALKKVEGGDF
jgi:glucokinase